MKLKFLIFLIIFINSLIVVLCDDQITNEVPHDGNNQLNSYQPLQIHLSLTDEESEVMITWLTKSKLQQATVYYYQGHCKELRDESFETLYKSNLNIKLSIGKSGTYPRYDGYVHHVVLENLQFGKDYCYSVGGSQIRNVTIIDYSTNSNSNVNIGNNTWSSWKNFKTVNSKDEPTIFAAVADSGTYGDVFEVSKILAKDSEITMLIHAGDLSYGKVEEKWDLFGEIFEPVTSKMPFMVIPGNWDVKEGAVEPFYNRYKMPLPFSKPISVLGENGQIQTQYNLFYSFKYGYVYNIMISSYDPYHNTSIQYKWLEKELKLANQMREDYPWIVVSAHSPMYSSSSGHNGSDTIFRSQLESLFRQYQVNLVLSGHDHGYERTYPVFDEYTFTKHPKNYTSTQGTIHIVVGTGGADHDPWLQRPNWTAHRESSAGYTKIMAHRHTLSIIYTRINGTVGDEFVIFNTPIYRSSPHAPFIIIFLIFLILVFPFCAYNKIPHKIFSSIMSHRDRKDFKSII